MRIKTFYNTDDKIINEWIKRNSMVLKCINILCNYDQGDIINTVIYELQGNEIDIFEA